MAFSGLLDGEAIGTGARPTGAGRRFEAASRLSREIRAAIFSKSQVRHVYGSSCSPVSLRVEVPSSARHGSAHPGIARMLASPSTSHPTLDGI